MSRNIKSTNQNGGLRKHLSITNHEMFHARVAPKAEANVAQSQLNIGNKITRNAKDICFLLLQFLSPGGITSNFTFHYLHAHSTHFVVYDY